jgi:hypothetical protein
MKIDLEKPLSAPAFAAIVGNSRQRVEQLIAAGTLAAGGTCGVWLLAYAAGLRKGATEGDGGELTAQRRRFLAARATGAEMDLQEREGKTVDTLATAQFVVDLAKRLMQDVRGLAPMIAGAVRDHPFDSATYSVDKLIKAVFDEALVRRELANCEPPLPLALAIARLRQPGDARELAEFEAKAERAGRKRELQQEVARLNGGGEPA